jgi:flagellar biosynthesis protein FliP
MRTTDFLLTKGFLKFIANCLTVLGLMLLPMTAALAQEGLNALSVTTAADGSQTYSLSLQVLALMTALTLLPAALLMMTSFTRIIIVLAILRTALGTAQTPTNQILIGLALFLTLFVMGPVFEKVNQDAVQPYLNDQITVQEGLQKASDPFRKFMMQQTRESDLALFGRISGQENIESPDKVPFTLLMPAFMTSELKTAFQIGFLLFIPFLIIDLVVASVLMAMGMMMLSPLIISLPFKIMLFVLVDGWTLVVGSLAASFY